MQVSSWARALLLAGCLLVVPACFSCQPCSPLCDPCVRDQVYFPAEFRAQYGPAVDSPAAVVPEIMAEPTVPFAEDVPAPAPDVVAEPDSEVPAEDTDDLPAPPAGVPDLPPDAPKGK